MDKTLKKADMMFRQAMKKDEAGDASGCDAWLEKAAAAEIEAIKSGDDPSQFRNLG